mmetsp:Transcript_45278/g.71607  ORF Transcript_45278/g.71607 Transcript_45278/m.71607 type:complete len:198 (-) Transcript_45278:43-636(-)
MHNVKRNPTDVDHRCEEALRQVLKPDHHWMIKGWMKSAGESEKLGIIRLSDIAEPRLFQRIGRPENSAQAERRQMRTTLNWADKFSSTSTNTCPGQGLPGTGFSFAGTHPLSHSMPMLPGPPASAGEDFEEIAKIKKPGGYCVYMTDSGYVQSMKNKQRNTGTFQLFGGSADYMTTHKSQYNLRNVGQEHLSYKIRS